MSHPATHPPLGPQTPAPKAAVRQAADEFHRTGRVAPLRIPAWADKATLPDGAQGWND